MKRKQLFTSHLHPVICFVYLFYWSASESQACNVSISAKRARAYSILSRDTPDDYRDRLPSISIPPLVTRNSVNIGLTYATKSAVRRPPNPLRSHADSCLEWLTDEHSSCSRFDVRPSSACSIVIWVLTIDSWHTFLSNKALLRV